MTKEEAAIAFCKLSEIWDKLELCLECYKVLHIIGSCKTIELTDDAQKELDDEKQRTEKQLERLESKNPLVMPEFEALLGYILVTNDKELMFKCCDLEYEISNYVEELEDVTFSESVYVPLNAMWNVLGRVKQNTLQKIWGMSRKEASRGGWKIMNRRCFKEIDGKTLIIDEDGIHYLENDKGEVEIIRAAPCDLTEREKKFYNRAIEAGFMEATSTGYKWLFGAPRCKTRLAYFLDGVERDHKGAYITAARRRELEARFNETGLKGAFERLMDTPKQKNKEEWHTQIDKLFED